MTTYLKPCPFCGCHMEVQRKKNVDGDIRPNGTHAKNCPLSMATWHMYHEDGWTEEKLAEAWNHRDEVDELLNSHSVMAHQPTYRKGLFFHHDGQLK